MSATTFRKSQIRAAANRAAQLRQFADTSLEPLAVAYRRRAAELEFVVAVFDDPPRAA